MVTVKRFSEFDAADLNDSGNKLAGISGSSVNIITPIVITWTSATRPTSPPLGVLGYNTDLPDYEYWDGDDWLPIASGGVGVVLVETGTGLTGGPITTSGTISFASIAANSLWVNNTVSAAVPAVTSLAALTKVNDTNITIDLGGVPDTALINPVSLTMGWLGVLSLARGGTNNALIADEGAIVYSTATDLDLLAATATANQIVLSGSNAAPNWSTATYPPTTTINQILYSSSANTIAGLATANSAMLVTNATGVPALSASLTDAQVVFGNTAAAPAPGNIVAGTGITINYSAPDLTISSELGLVAAPNMIIGGDFGINPWQRGTTFTGLVAEAYTADRWVYNLGGLGTAIVDVSKSASAPTVAQAGIYSTASLHLNVTTEDATIAAGDFYTFAYRMEGYDFTGIAQREFTLSFSVRATVIGTYCVGFVNAGADRSYVAEYEVLVSDTWEEKTITVSASPSAGTWDYGNGIGISIIFPLAAGSTYQTTPDAWQTGEFFATANQVNDVATVGNDFYLDLVKVEPGTVATPYPAENREEILNKCCRYYQKSFNQGVTPAQATGDISGTFGYTVDVAGVRTYRYEAFLTTNMRATPTVVFYNPVTASTTWYNYTDAGNSGASALSVASSQNKCSFNNTQLATDGVGENIRIHATMDAEL